MTPSRDHYVVHVVDEINPRAAGHAGCAYTSAPHTAGHALELVRALLGCPTPPPTGEGPWAHPVAGGKRIVTMAPADLDGQLHLDAAQVNA